MAAKCACRPARQSPFPVERPAFRRCPRASSPIDFNYDFKTDLVLAGAGGVRLLRQDNPKAFTDVTSQAKLPEAVINAHYTGAWAVDIEADGDLDIVLGAADGTPVVLRNNGDGTFLPILPFSGISGVAGFAWADLDGDGNPDAAIIDATGKLHVFMNLRQGQFHERPLPPGFSSVKTVAVADASNNGILDLLAVLADGAIIRISDKNEGQSWETTEIAECSRTPAAFLRAMRVCTSLIWITTGPSICFSLPLRRFRAATPPAR